MLLKNHQIEWIFSNHSPYSSQINFIKSIFFFFRSFHLILLIGQSFIRFLLFLYLLYFSLMKNYEGTLFKNREDLTRLIFGGYITDEEISDRPLSKLTKDILEQLEIS